jgi:hypothetical protein
MVGQPHGNSLGRSSGLWPRASIGTATDNTSEGLYLLNFFTAAETRSSVVHSA